jgi:hypothetical protein
MNNDSLALQTDGLTEPAKNYNTFQIKTVPDGYNSGRSYYLRTKQDPASSRIIQHLCDITKTARKRAVALSRFNQAQNLVRRFHDSTIFQLAVSLLIITVCPCPCPHPARQSSPTARRQNFVINAAQAQFMDVIRHEDGSPTDMGVTLDYVDTFFTVAFTVELAMNMFCHWLRPFLCDGRREGEREGGRGGGVRREREGGRERKGGRRERGRGREGEEEGRESERER